MNVIIYITSVLHIANIFITKGGFTLKRSLKTYISSLMIAAMSVSGLNIPNVTVFGTPVLANDTVESGAAVVPAAGSSYSYDFGKDDSYAAGSNVTSEDGYIKFESAGSTTYHSAAYGIVLGVGDKVSVAVAGNSDVTFRLSNFGSGFNCSVKDADDNVLDDFSSTGKTDKQDSVYRYEGEATVLTFTYEGAGSGYLTYVKVKNDDANAKTLVPAASGQKDALDFATAMAAAGKSQGNMIDDTLFSDGSTIQYKGTGQYHSYGAYVSPGDTFKVNVAGNAKISFTNLSSYSSAGAVMTVTSSEDAALNDTFTLKMDSSMEKQPYTYEYLGDAATLTFTVSGGKAYMGGVKVENAVASYQVWFQDLVKSGKWDLSQGAIASAPGVSLFGMGADTKFAEKKPYVVSDTESHMGYKAGNRPNNSGDFSTLLGIGDGNALAFTAPGDGNVIVYVYLPSSKNMNYRVYGSDNKLIEGPIVSEAASETQMKLSLAVKAGNTYYFSTTGTNDLSFAGVQYLAEEAITVTANYSGIELGSAEISLIDTISNKEAAVLTATSNVVKLAKGHTYELRSNDAAKKALIDGKTSFVATSNSIDVVIEEVEDVTLTGKLVSDDASFDPASITDIVFASMVDGKEYKVSESGELKADGSYSITMKPGEFNTSVVSAEGYSTKDRVSVSTDASANVNNVYIEPLAYNKEYNLHDEFVASGSSILTFTNARDHGDNMTLAMGSNSSIVVPVSGKKTVSVAGWWNGKWSMNGQAFESNSTDSPNAGSAFVSSYTTDGTETAVTIECDGAYLLNLKVTDPVEEIAFTNEISVPGDYATLTEAVKAIKNMKDRPEGEDGRVTIKLTADLQEQVLVNVPYVTIDGGEGKHEISWYYGTTGKYYSVDENGYFNRSLFMDKYSKRYGSGSLWGGVVIVTGNYFKANNVVFKNTYNYEVTDMEIEDGAEQLGELRLKSTDVQAYKYKERSNALYVNANNIEITNCDILSSQDTLGVNGERSTVAYFKNCTIGGNVDFICGAGAMVFDDCTLQWKTYSDSANNAKIGYLCAPKSKPYVFRNCVVTQDKENAGTVLGLYGRTWGQNSNATFYKTETNGLINTIGWTEMNADDLLTATFYEQDNLASGSAFETTGRTAKTASANVPAQPIPDELVASYTTDKIITDVLNGWIPDSYVFKGDVNKDGVVDEMDAKAILSIVASISGDYDTDQADFDGNGSIETLDAIALLVYLDA